jgi:hypothetical protein
MDAMFRFLFGLVGELSYRLDDAERRLRELESKGKKGKTGTAGTAGGQ